MPFICAILLLGLALSNSAFAADEDGVYSGRRLIQPAADAALSNGVQPLHARGPGALFTSVEATAVDALTYAYLQARKAHDTARIRAGTIYVLHPSLAIRSYRGEDSQRTEVANLRHQEQTPLFAGN